MNAIIAWFKDTRQFLGFWFEESWKEVVKWGATGWGLVTIIVAVIWTVLTHIVPMLSLLLDTLNGLVTGNWNYEPPAAIMNILAIGNTFTPLQELMQYAITYGTLKGSLLLYRWVKTLIPTEAGV